MNPSLQVPQVPPVPLPPRASALGEGRALLHFHVAAAAASVWAATYPPLGDLPQHAGQVALALDLLHGSSRWQDLVTFNFFTPYLIGYGLIALAAQFMSIAAAVKLVLSLSVLGFFHAASALRRRFGAPAVLDWLLLAGFFGFAFKWGFLTFLLAAPVGLWFLLKSIDFAERPDVGGAVRLAALGGLLFFSHGLVFMACVGMGACYAALEAHAQRRAVLLRLAPYLLLALLTVGYAQFASHVAHAQTTEAKAFQWGWTPTRPVRFFRFQWDVALRAKSDPLYLLSAFAYALFYLSPLLLGCRFRPTLRRAIPFGTVVLIGLAVPHTAMTTAFLYERFALFLLPFWVLLFEPGDGRAPAGEGWRRFALAAVPAICLTATGWRVWTFHQFERESHDFQAILEAMPPQQRVLSMVFDQRSPAADNPHSYLHYPAWYQAEKRGFVDSNFAQWLPQIVRFRAGQATVQSPFEWKPYRFEWARHHGERFDYIVLRNPKRLFPRFAGLPCEIELVRTAGPWALYRRLPGSCPVPLQAAHGATGPGG